MKEEVLLEPCPICGQSALAGYQNRYTCASCGTQVEQGRWLGVWPHDRFYFRAIGSDFRDIQSELIKRPFTKAQLTDLAGSCYTDADLAAIAAGDLTLIDLPTSTVAQVMFPQSRETCYVHVSNLERAEGPTLSDGVERVHNPADRRTLTILDRGNLFISDQRMIFPSDSHTIIRLDRNLTGVRTFTDAVGVQLQGEGKATYFLGFRFRDVSLVSAYLRGRLAHLR